MRATDIGRAGHLLAQLAKAKAELTVITYCETALITLGGGKHDQLHISFIRSSPDGDRAFEILNDQLRTRQLDRIKMLESSLRHIGVEP